MSTIKADAVTAVGTNGDLSLDGLGTGGVSIASTLKMTKGGDISSASPLVIDTDGNYFDVTGTTNFAAMTVEEGNFFMLQFDGALTITHGSGIEIPGGANVTTAAGDRLLCYATAANTVEVMSFETEAPIPSAGWIFVESVTASGSSTIDLGEGNILAGNSYQIDCIQVANSVDMSAANSPKIQFGTSTGPTYQTSGYTSQNGSFTGGAYAYGGRDPTTSGIPVTNSALGPMGGAAAGETWDSIVQIHNPAAATEHRVSSYGGAHEAAGLEIIYLTSGHRTTAETITGFRILPGTGDFTSGLFVLSRRKITA